MKNTLKTTLGILFLFLSLNGQAQIEEVLERLNLYSLVYPKEKVFLHVDRTTYGDGETVWFQAYVTISPLGTFTDLSNTLYVQLLDQNDELITEEKVFVENGAGAGHLELPDDLANGRYQLVAFTKWMRNFEEASYFRKDIDILSAFSEDLVNPSNKSQGIDLQFLAESGSFIADIPTKVAFKAVDSNGQPSVVSGQVIDEENAIVADFTSTHDGMGTVFLTPQAGKSYQAKLKDGQAFDLPQVQNKGAHLKVNYLDDQVKVSVIQLGYENTAGNFHLLIHNKGFISSALQVEAKRNLSIVNLSFEKLDEGINSLTLLDQDLNPIAERLIFIEKDQTKIAAEWAKLTIGTRSKASVDIQLDLPDTVSAVLSASAVDISQTPEEKNTNHIISELLLSSELAGNIHDPAFYFEQSKAKRLELLDLLMLTHGWRSFDFSAIAQGDFPAIDELPEKGVLITGRAFKIGKKEKVAKNADLVLIRQHPELPVILQTTTDKEGYFEFTEAIISQNDSLIIRGSREKNGKANLRIEFDTLEQNFPSKYFGQPALTTAPIEKAENFVQLKEERKQIDEAYGFLLDSTATQLDDVVVEGYKTETRPDSVLFKTQIGRGDDAEDFNDPMYSGSYATVFNALIGKIPGVQISPDGGVSIRQAGRINGSEPLFLLNDVPVDKSLIEQLTVQQIDRVVVFKSLAKTAIYGSEAVGGIMAFYTKEGGGMRKDKQKVSIANFLNGYQANKVFYAPKYDQPKAEHIIPDRRVLVHWEPMIILTGNESKTIQFWSSDLEGTIAVEINGLTTEGEPFYYYKTLEVKEVN